MSDLPIVVIIVEYEITFLSLSLSLLKGFTEKCRDSIEEPLKCSKLHPWK